MIVWGGGGAFADPPLNTGGLYDPVGDRWSATPTQGAPSAREVHTAVWTGSRMVVWGGGDFDQFDFTNTGGLYDPAGGSWKPTTTEGAPSERFLHTAVWSGSRMIVWGDRLGGQYASGGVYDPDADSWVPTNEADAPDARGDHLAVWTGSRMVVWGGFANGNTDYYNTGGGYDPVSDSWTATSLVNASVARQGGSAVWTGSSMIVWGGQRNLFGPQNTGSQWKRLSFYVKD